jgi:hypothetical protein
VAAVVRQEDAGEGVVLEVAVEDAAAAVRQADAVFRGAAVVAALEVAAAAALEGVEADFECESSTLSSCMHVSRMYSIAAEGQLNIKLHLDMIFFIRILLRN